MSKPKLNITIPEDVLKALKELAIKENRNVSNMTTVLIQRGIEKDKAALS